MITIITIVNTNVISGAVTDSVAAQKIDQSENANLMKKTLINKDDNPALAWKNLILEKTSLFNRLKI